MRVIFLDLDRTLIGEDYSPEPAGHIVDWLKNKGFEIIFNSSKTRAEQEYYRKALDIEAPFIVENGSAVYIPEDYFDFEIPGLMRDSYIVVELGERYAVIKSALDAISDEFGLKYYGNSTLEEVVGFTGLPERLAMLAMRREYSETVFLWKKEGFAERLKNLKVSRGSRFFSVHGDTDKGKAARVLLSLYRRLGNVESYAVGDAPNDIPLLNAVDHPYIMGTLTHPGGKNIKNIKSIEELKEVIL